MIPHVHPEAPAGVLGHPYLPRQNLTQALLSHISSLEKFSYGHGPSGVDVGDHGGQGWTLVLGHALMIYMPHIDPEYTE